MKVLDFGLKDYQEILKLQRSIFKKKLEGEKEDFLLIGEHFPVYTCGKRTKDEHIYHIPEKVPVFHIERGGSITFHGQGQIVAYPVIDLKRKKLSVKRFVYLLEEAMIRTCLFFGVEVFRKEGFPGVFTKDGKIGFIGVHISRFISMHGISLNVCAEKEYFKKINPCGINTEVVNITDYKDVSLKEVKEKLTYFLTELM